MIVHNLKGTLCYCSKTESLYDFVLNEDYSPSDGIGCGGAAVPKELIDKLRREGRSLKGMFYATLNIPDIPGGMVWVTDLYYTRKRQREQKA